METSRQVWVGGSWLPGKQGDVKPGGLQGGVLPLVTLLPARSDMGSLTRCPVWNGSSEGL